MPSERKQRVELLQGTLDLIVLRTLATMGPQHAYGIAARLDQISEHPFTLNQGTLYPALLRLEQRGWIKAKWGTSDNNRRARFYELTSAGRARIRQERTDWDRTVALMERFLRTAE